MKTSSRTHHIIAYARPWAFDSLLSYYNLNIDEVDIISDFRSVDRVGLCRHIEICRKEGTTDLCRPSLDHTLLCDIIARCRLLRLISFHEATFLIGCIYSFADKLFSKKSYKQFFLLPVDNYILHVLAIVASKYNVECIAHIASPISDYSRRTVLGEANVNPSANGITGLEIAKILSNTANLPPYMKKARISLITSSQIAFAYAKLLSFAKLLAMFAFARVLGPDSHYHYATSTMSRLSSISYLNLATASSLKSKFADSDQLSSPFVYIPFHVYPECTVDYWSSPEMAANYYNEILCIISNLSKIVTVVVKDHPSNLKGYPRCFVQTLGLIPNLKIASARSSSREIISSDNCAGVFVNSGVAGLEAIAIGKKILYPSKKPPYYIEYVQDNLFPNDFISVSRNPDLERLSNLLFAPQDPRAYQQALDQFALLIEKKPMPRHLQPRNPLKQIKYTLGL